MVSKGQFVEIQQLFGNFLATFRHFYRQHFWDSPATWLSLGTEPKLEISQCQLSFSERPKDLRFSGNGLNSPDKFKNIQLEYIKDETTTT